MTPRDKVLVVLTQQSCGSVAQNYADVGNSKHDHAQENDVVLVRPTKKHGPMSQTLSLAKGGVWMWYLIKSCKLASKLI